MKLTLTTITPVHIGTGNRLEPFDFYIHNDRVLVLNHDNCLEALFDTTPKNLDRYVAWVEETTRQMENAEAEVKRAKDKRDRKLITDKNQVLSNIRRRFNIIDFTETILKNTSLASEFKSNDKYRWYSGYIMGKPRSVVQLAEIIKINGMPYIPGSSIKGAIRTALAFLVISELDEPGAERLLARQDKQSPGIRAMLSEIIEKSDVVKSNIQNHSDPQLRRAFGDLDRTRKNYEKRIGEEVEKFVFGCAESEKELAKLNDPKFDLMRLVRVSDTTKANAEILFGEMKAFKYDRMRRQIGSQPISIAEFIDAGSRFEFSIEVDAFLIKRLFDKPYKAGWINYADKFTRLFKITEEEVKSISPDALGNRVIIRILEALKSFSQTIRQKEEHWLEQFSSKETNRLVKVLQDMKVDAVYTKMGFASGWFATTVGLAFAQNPYLEHILPDIIYAFNLDLIQNQERLLRYPSNRRGDVEKQIKLLNRIPDVQNFPKSRRLIADRFLPEDYIGWVEISEGGIGQIKHPKKHERETLSATKEENFEDALEKLKAKFN